MKLSSRTECPVNRDSIAAKRVSCVRYIEKTFDVPYFVMIRLRVQFSGKPPDDLSQLLPDEWLKSHPEACRRWSR